MGINFTNSWGQVTDNTAQLAEIAQHAIQDTDLEIVPISRNLFDKTAITTGYEVYNDGSFHVESDSVITDYIKVSGAYVYVSGLTTYTGLDRNYAFYDTDKVYVTGSRSSIWLGFTERGIPIPTGAVYFVMSVYQRKTGEEVVDLDTIQIELNGQKTDYVAYEEGVNQLKTYKIGFDASDTTVAVSTTGKNLLIFGDSIAETATVSDDGATYEEGTRSNWPKYSKPALQVAGMYNYAKSGATFLDRAEIEARQKMSVQINTAIANNRLGDIIVFNCGTNDGDQTLGVYATVMAKATINDLVRDNVYESLRWAYWRVKTAYPNAICFQILPTQTACYDVDPDLLDAITIMAKRYNFILIDAFSESGIVKEFEVDGSEGRYLSDGLHPNTAGQQLLSDFINLNIWRNMN
jgi:lysophospholipase L1-like esterase